WRSIADCGRLLIQRPMSAISLNSVLAASGTSLRSISRSSTRPCSMSSWLPESLTKDAGPAGGLGRQHCDGHPRIVDVLAGGTSLRLTQSADCTSYLAHHDYSIHELIAAMRHMVSRTS